MSQRSAEPALDELADRLHSAAIHLLRRLRRADDASGLSAPQLSALSVLVFGGPSTPGALAAAEQVRPPTMTRLLVELERAGLVERLTDPHDRRRHAVSATPRAQELLARGRHRRTASLAAQLADLPDGDRALLVHATDVLERLVHAPPCDPPSGPNRRGE